MESATTLGCGPLVLTGPAFAPLGRSPDALAVARPCPTRPAAAPVFAIRPRPWPTGPSPGLWPTLAPLPPWGQGRWAALPRLPALRSRVLERCGCHNSSQPPPEKLIMAASA